jgi:hypothetical protein
MLKGLETHGLTKAAAIQIPQTQRSGAKAPDRVLSPFSCRPPRWPVVVWILTIPGLGLPASAYTFERAGGGRRQPDDNAGHNMPNHVRARLGQAPHDPSEIEASHPDGEIASPCPCRCILSMSACMTSTRQMNRHTN